MEFADYEIRLPSQGIRVKAGEFVEFVATSRDVTYGFGVFRKDGRMVFQMQVVPGYENRIVWKFDKPGLYDVRSTEYSGPRHPGDAITTKVTKGTQRTQIRLCVLSGNQLRNCFQMRRGPKYGRGSRR